ncbi:MAG TPA: hypothetical protein VKG84_01430, partial [Candidatus Acidoferrales bacterium]|nr:hypothetical protein [Candidatus Acidoferrales bacterium]
PAMINITTTPSPAIAVTCTLQTNCVAQLMGPRGPEGPGTPMQPFAAFSGLLLLAAMLLRSRVFGLQRRGPWAARLAPVCAMLLLVMLVMTWTACVSNPPPTIPGAPTTPAGVYQIEIQATAPGGVKQSVPLTVHVI